MKKEFIHRGEILKGEDLLREYRDRRKTIIEENIKPDDPVPSDWKESEKKFKTIKRIYKEKSIADQLEDKLWCLLHDIGFDRLNTRYFSMILKERGGVKKTKQIDVFGVDEDIVVVAECKSREKWGRKELAKDIAEFEKNKRHIANSAKKILEKDNIRFVYIFATENIDWYENDFKDAEEAKITVFDEHDIMALQELSKIAGEGAKYQIYNRIFHGSPIRNFEIRVPALRAKMGGQKYYSFVMKPADLLKIAYVHKRGSKSSFLDLRNSYQRMINKTRINNINEFISDGGFFPGNIIINFNKPLKKEELLGDKKVLSKTTDSSTPVIITLPSYYGCAWIIDGQHRIYGYADVKEKHTETISVVAFVNQPAKEQAKIFVDINKNQKAIETNLMWDLYEDLYYESEDEKEMQLYAISKIAKILNEDRRSPYRNQIEIPSLQNTGNISLYALCNSILQQKLISRTEGLLYKNNYEDSIYYAVDHILVFFQYFKNEMPKEWDLGDKHYINTKASIPVFMGILRDLVETNTSPLELNDIKLFTKVVEKFMEPLALHLMTQDEETINSYRAVGGVQQKSREIRANFTKIIQDGQKGFRSIWAERYEESKKHEESFDKKKKGVNYYLDHEEGENIEFKGSLRLIINKYLLHGGKIEFDEELPRKSVLKAIVGFLNTEGGDILIGVAEKNKYKDFIEDENTDVIFFEDKIVVGINIEYNKNEWDGYLQRITHLIKNRIGTEVLDSGYLDIEKIQYEEKDLCLIKIRPSDSKQFLDGKDFFVRRGNITDPLGPKEIEDYWKHREKKIARQSAGS